jgi:putative RecB family exonuclease
MAINTISEERVKPHLSFSQINMFLRCPKQYEYRYILGKKIPPSGAMAQSSAWHSAVQVNYEQKIGTSEDLPEEEALSIFSDEFDRRFNEEEVRLEPEENVGKLKDQGVDITRTYHSVIAPTVDPRWVEKEFRVSLGDEFPYDLLGYWDCVETDGVIVDSKAYKKTPTQFDLDKDLQFTTYSAAYRISEQVTETGMRMDIMVKNKKPKAVQLYTTRTNEQIKWYFSLVEKVVMAIKAGNFFPNPSGWHCSPKFCGYWSNCMRS